MKIQGMLDAVAPAGNEGTVTVESGQGAGGSGGPAADGNEHELSILCVLAPLEARYFSPAHTGCCQEEGCEVSMSLDEIVCVTVQI